MQHTISLVSVHVSTKACCKVIKHNPGKSKYLAWIRSDLLLSGPTTCQCNNIVAVLPLRHILLQSSFSPNSPRFGCSALLVLRNLSTENQVSV